MTSPWTPTPRERLTDADKARLFVERGGQCWRCTKRLRPGDRWIVEHLIALENGGTNDWENLGITGMCCKASKDARDHAQAGKQRRTATKHLVSKSMRKRSNLAKKPGTKYDWNRGGYVREQND